MSRKIAFAGVFAGISVVLLYIGSIMPTGKLTLYFLASLPIAFTIIESGIGAGVTLYFAVCILAALVSGNIYGVVPFMLFFGHYPVFKFLIERNRKAFAELLLKLVIFNVSMVLWYFLFKSIFLQILPAQLAGGRMLFIAGIVAMQVIFFIYDYVFSRLLFYYESRLNTFRRG